MHRTDRAGRSARGRGATLRVRAASLTSAGGRAVFNDPGAGERAR